MMRSRFRALLTIAAVTVVALATSASAAVLTVGTTPPGVDGEDIANLVAGTGGEKLWTDTRAIGQTFTTGGQDVTLDAVTLQLWGSAEPTKEYTITVGEVSGTSYTAMASESATQTSPMASGDYATFSLDTPLSLSANTEYGFDLAMVSSTSGWQSGIPYMARTGDVYAGGQQFRSQQDHQSTPTIGLIGGDKVFHLNMAAEGGGELSGELGILTPETLAGNNPATGAPWKAGDQYRLAFFTSDTTTAESPDISTYNAWVQGLADATTAYDIGADDGATWKAIGSTDTVDARDNTSTNPNEDGTGHAVFLLDGSTLVASDYLDLWDGDIQHIIDLTELGTVETHWPFTGTFTDGTASEDHGASFGALGHPILGGQVGQGNSSRADQWIWRTWTGAPATNQLQMYALSDPLTIQGEVDAIPEPATLSLVGLGALLALRRRRRRR